MFTSPDQLTQRGYSFARRLIGVELLEVLGDVISHHLGILSISLGATRLALGVVLESLRVEHINMELIGPGKVGKGEVITSSGFHRQMHRLLV